MRILVTDGDERAALAAARSLVRAGHVVHAAGRRRVSLAGAARGVRGWGVRVDALAEPAAFAAAVGALAARVGAELVLPVTDASVEALLEQRQALPAGVVLPLPDLQTYRAASDKARLLTLAAVAGFGVPETRIVTTREAGDACVPQVDFFPAVVKPHRSVVTAGGGRVKTVVTPVADPAACRRALAALPDAAFPVLIQRRVEGVGEGFFALRWGGRMVAMFAHRRLREKPPSGGVSVYRESIALDEGLARPGIRLLDTLGWNGVAMIECRRDAATGRQMLMEINGRFWGSLQLAVDAGVDFPALLVRCAAGDSVTDGAGYRVGVRSRWLWGDVDQLLSRLRRSNGDGSRWGALRDFLRVDPRRDRAEVWRWSDPLPFVVETLGWLRSLHV